MNELDRLVLNLILVAVIFYFFNILSIKLKPVFLMKGDGSINNQMRFGFRKKEKALLKMIIFP